MVVDHWVGYGSVVHLNIRYLDVVDRAVVIETVSLPVPALIARAFVAVSIVDPAVVTDIPAPVSVAVAVTTARVVPISWRPQIPCLRRSRPSAGHPEVTLRGVAPVSGRP